MEFGRSKPFIWIRPGRGRADRTQMSLGRDAEEDRAAHSILVIYDSFLLMPPLARATAGFAQPIDVWVWDLHAGRLPEDHRLSQHIGIMLETGRAGIDWIRTVARRSGCPPIVYVGTDDDPWAPYEALVAGAFKVLRYMDELTVPSLTEVIETWMALAPGGNQLCSMPCE